MGADAGAGSMPLVTIAFVIDDLGLGGAQRQLVELLKGLPRERYACRVISLSSTKSDYAAALRSLGVPLQQIPQSGKWDWRCLRSLRRALRERRPDIVHTWLFSADLYGRLAAWLADVPVIVSAVRSVDAWKPRHHIWADRLLRGVTDAFTVNAQAISHVLTSREHVLPGRIHTIYNGVDLRLFDPAEANGTIRRTLQLGRQAPLVGIVGRLMPVKDHTTFLRACALVAEQQPDARFLIVGSGPLREELTRLAQGLGLASRAHFLESQLEAAEVFSALDVVVVSSRYEGCCNVILEGMAMGKPVVATAVGGNPELVRDGETGLLVPPQDPEAMAQAIVRCLQDPAQSRRLGARGRLDVEARFRLERMVAETDALYQRLVR